MHRRKTDGPITCRECEHADMFGYMQGRAKCKLTGEIIKDCDKPLEGCKYENNNA